MVDGKSTAKRKRSRVSATPGVSSRGGFYNNSNKRRDTPAHDNEGLVGSATPVRSLFGCGFHDMRQPLTYLIHMDLFTSFEWILARMIRYSYLCFQIMPPYRSTKKKGGGGGNRGVWTGENITFDPVKPVFR